MPEHKIEWNDFTPIQTKKTDIFSGKTWWLDVLHENFSIFFFSPYTNKNKIQRQFCLFWTFFVWYKVAFLDVFKKQIKFVFFLFFCESLFCWYEVGLSFQTKKKMQIQLALELANIIQLITIQTSVRTETLGSGMLRLLSQKEILLSSLFRTDIACIY